MFKCISDFQDFLYSSYDIQDELNIIPEICPPNMNGDITINCFRLSKPLRQKPNEIADSAESFFKTHSDIIEVEKMKAFINLTIKPSRVHLDTVANIANILKKSFYNKQEQQKILIEFSAPNTNKPQHLGHVRNNTIGMALASLLKRAGHIVIPVNLVNDRGIHICKSMIAYQRFGNNTTPESANIKGDHFVGKYYVKYNDELKKQLCELRKNNPELKDTKDDDLFLKTEIGKATQKMLQDWENKNENVRTLWEKMNNWVFKGFEETYNTMGIKFNKTYLESNTYLLGKDIISKELEKGILKKRDDGAIMIELGGKLGEKVLLRSDGTSVYITQDIGTTIMKNEEFHPDKQIWVVGDEQIFHFKQLFATLKKMGHKWADGLYHLAYGMVNLPSGKMKSREGTVVDADDLFNEMINLAKSATIERYKENLPSDIDERSEIIGMGALKFMLLKFNPKTTIMFDPEESLKFEGDTGPYVQYACSRINSIERKANDKNLIVDEDNIKWNLLASQYEKQLSIRASFYPNVIKAATEKLDCSILISYLLDLAKEFNRFYRECPVLKAENNDLLFARLAISYRIRDILKDGLNTLTIKVPKAM